MSLTRKDIDEIMRLLEQSRFSELRLETGDIKLHIRRPGAALPQAEASSPPPMAHTPAAPPPAIKTPPPPAPGEADVLSPLLGVFYRAPKPGEAPFVEPGQEIEEDTIIGIVEVMKLMNSVRAGMRGVVVEVFAANAEMVEYEQPLIRIRKTA